MRMVIMGALILVAITSFSVPEGLVKKLPAIKRSRRVRLAAP